MQRRRLAHFLSMSQHNERPKVKHLVCGCAKQRTATEDQAEANDHHRHHGNHTKQSRETSQQKHRHKQKKDNLATVMRCKKNTTNEKIVHPLLYHCCCCDKSRELFVHKGLGAASPRQVPTSERQAERAHTRQEQEHGNAATLR